MRIHSVPMPPCRTFWRQSSPRPRVRERGNSHILASKASPNIVCILNVIIIFCWFENRISLKDLKLVWSKSFEMNWSQTNMGSSVYAGWMRGMMYAVISSLHEWTTVIFFPCTWGFKTSPYRLVVVDDVILGPVHTMAKLRKEKRLDRWKCINVQSPSSRPSH